MPGPPRGPSAVGQSVDRTGGTVVHQSSGTVNTASNDGFATGPSPSHSAGSAAGRTVVLQSTSSAPSGMASHADHNQYQRFQDNDSFSNSVNAELDCKDFLVNSDMLTRSPYDIEKWKDVARQRPRRVGQGDGFDSWKSAAEYARANETEKLEMPKFDKAKKIMGDSYVGDPATSEEHHAAQLYTNKMWALFHASGKVPEDEAAQMGEVHNVILDKTIRRRSFIEDESGNKDSHRMETMLHNGVSLAPDAVQEFAQIESMCINGMCKGDDSAVTYLTNVARINPKATVTPEKTGQLTQDGSRQSGTTGVFQNRDRYDDLQVQTAECIENITVDLLKDGAESLGDSQTGIISSKGTSLIVRSVRTALRCRRQCIHGNKDVTDKATFEDYSKVKPEYDHNGTPTVRYQPIACSRAERHA